MTKFFLFALAPLLAAFPALADGPGSDEIAPVYVTGVVADGGSQELLIGVRHSGCNAVDFDFKVGACTRSFPPMCQASLTPKENPGPCEMLLEYVVRINSEDAGINNSNFAGAEMWLKGTDGSARSFELPATWGAEVPLER